MSDMGRVLRNEFRLIMHDAGVLIFFLVLPLIYPLVYTLIYNPEVVRKLPIAVVDNSLTAKSRSLVRKADASPSIQIYSYCANMSEAKEQMAEGKVYGIMQIPSDYAEKIGKGEPAHVEFYSDMSLLLRYRTFTAALTDLQLELISDITGERISAIGMESAMAGSSGMPIESRSHFLGDSEQGFASFVIPGIVILILQQSMLLGITMLGGTSRERRRRNSGIDPEEVSGVGLAANIWGKTLCYTVLYIPLSIYIMHIVPEIFRLPHCGNLLEYLLFIFPMLLATAFLGQTLNLFMKERESAFIVLVFTSVFFLFLSGLTWPRYAMSPLWIWIGNCIPAVWGVDGFIRLNSNAASFYEVAGAFKAMWILVVVYMITAGYATKVLSGYKKVTHNKTNNVGH